MSELAETVLILVLGPGTDLERGRFVDVLQRAGYGLFTAGTAEEALDHLGRHRAHLLLLDDLAFYAQLRSAGQDVPAILVTDLASEALVIQARRMGVRDFVPRSVEYLDYLPEAVARVLRQVQTEQRLADSEARFGAFMNNSPGISFIKDEEGRYVFVSDTCERHLGWPAAHQIGKSDDELWPAEVAGPLREHDRIVLSSGQPIEVEESVPVSKGQGAHWHVSKFPLADRFGHRFVGGVAINITAQKRTQEQLRQAQKMEAIGKLAGGVAHDFNNLLTVILGYSELLQRSFAVEEQVGEIVREVHKAGERAALLTHQLLALSRQKVLAPRVLDLNKLVIESEKMFRRLLGATIEINCVLLPGLGLVKADPGGLEQVLLNLVVNARDAMPQGGLLTLETRNVELPADYAPELRPGPHVLLAVSDTGCGMDEATKGQIFEPFFTTKGLGKGTGLGLSMVHSMVKQSGGHISVYSEAGKGTTFKIYLPCVLDRGPAQGETEAALQVPRGTETVLLAEDDDSVRALARTALLSSGYTVLEARDGQEALEVSQQAPGPIHLLATDVVMPKMNGRQLAEHLTARWPGLQVLYMSGYTDDAIVRHGVLEKGMAFLQKPFTPITLARKVREVLDEPSSAG
jgi:PAS domain S-box-containing protein